jgi:hypothetical protein
MSTARQAEIAAIHVVMRQVKKLSGHRQRFTANAARITDPVGGNRQTTRANMVSTVFRGARTPGARR